MAEERLDLVVFGATGFVGQLVVEEVARIAEEEGNISWGIAGRNKDKLENIKQQAASQTGKNLDDVKVIVADVEDEDSLDRMAKQAKVVLNCVGPYRFYGEQVVKACVENATSHVDISGEPLFMEGVQFNYHEKAKKAGCYVVGACASDFIPGDMGVVYLQKNFEGDLNSVEAYLKLEFGPAGYRGIPFATYRTVLYEIGDRPQLETLHRKMHPNRPPKPEYKLESRGIIHYSDVFNHWCIPHVDVDRSIVERTQLYDFEQHGKKPIQFLPYITIGSWFTTVCAIFALACFKFCATFSPMRRFMEKFPRLFSCGLVHYDGPTREQIEQASFRMTFVGEGWKDKTSSDHHGTPPDTRMKVEVTGPEQGYATTPICLVQAALVILKEKDKIPGSGGVLTSGTAFRDTSLISRLDQHGVQFRVV